MAKTSLADLIDEVEQLEQAVALQRLDLDRAVLALRANRQRVAEALKNDGWVMHDGCVYTANQDGQGYTRYDVKPAELVDVLIEDRTGIQFQVA